MIKIVLHSLPNELDQIAWIVDQLKRCSNFVDPSRFILEFTLNVSEEDVNWQESKVSRDYCIEKFNLLFKKSPFVNRPIVSLEPTGCNTVRRNAIREADNVTDIIGLDPDLLFTEYTLYILQEAIDSINHDYYIITPQIFQLWDSSWDIISHKDFCFTPREEKLWLKDPYMLFKHSFGEVKVTNLPYFKFDGGWMTVYSKKLLQLIDIPDSLGHYGLDDTFISSCANMLKESGYNANQYLVENLLVVEDRVYRSASMDPFITLVDHKDRMRENSHSSFQNELVKFRNKI